MIGRDSSKKRRVRFALQELGRRGQEEPRRKAGERKLSTADDSECDHLVIKRLTRACLVKFMTCQFYECGGVKLI